MSTAPRRWAWSACSCSKWILAYAGLSAVWFLSDAVKPELDLAVAELAAAELAKA
ncbi:MAG TPA: hypothetical protein VFE11_03120 [Dongiaceae bacterium]|nr:hypothetical protein [Dongiaceae bacterium]